MRQLGTERFSSLVIVDMDPRWAWGHTYTWQADTRLETPAQAVAIGRVWDNLSYLTLPLEDAGYPIVTIHQTSLSFYDLTPLRNTEVALCGMYGGQCVKSVEEWLMDQWGIKATNLIDGIVWPSSETPTGIRIGDAYWELELEERGLLNDISAAVW